MSRPDGSYLDSYGNLYYYRNGTFHRDDGPAVIMFDKSCQYWVNGLRHRLSGPAIDDKFDKRYYVLGKQVSEQDILLFQKFNNPDEGNKKKK